MNYTQQNIYIKSIGTAVPQLKLLQAEIAAQQCDLWGLNQQEATRLVHLFQKTGIQHRYSAFDIWSPSTPVHQLRDWIGADIGQKMLWYRAAARKLAKEAVGNLKDQGKSLASIGALITVSCTGQYAPGLEIDLLHDLGLPLDTARYAYNFVGCYAAVPAIDLASALVAQLPAGKNVLVVLVELCSLHYHANWTADAALAHALFADGAAAIVVCKEKDTQGNLLKINEIKQNIIPNESAMAWQIGPQNFLMQLSAYVPAVLNQGFKALKADWDLNGRYPQHYALHPGGKKILEVFAKEMGLENEALSHSYEVLANYGNMSSVTLPFVLSNLLNGPGKKGPVWAAAFGPGLTLASMDLELE